LLPTGLHDFMAMERGLKEEDVMALMRGKIVKTLRAELPLGCFIVDGWMLQLAVKSKRALEAVS